MYTKCVFNFRDLILSYVYIDIYMLSKTRLSEFFRKKPQLDNWSFTKLQISEHQPRYYSFRYSVLIKHSCVLRDPKKYRIKNISAWNKNKIHWRFSMMLICKKCKKYGKVCVFWKCIQYTTHWDETQMLKKIPSNKINGTKNALFFLSQAPTHHGFTFNLRFLHELKHKVRLLKLCVGFFIFDYVSFFLKFMFLFNKMHVVFDFKTS